MKGKSNIIMNENENDQHHYLTRREMLFVGAALAGIASLGINAPPSLVHTAGISGTSLPVQAIEQIMETNNAAVVNGVLTIELDRNDLHVIGPHGIPFKPAWELNGEFFFSRLATAEISRVLNKINVKRS